MLTLLLFPSAFYWGDPCKNCWNETAGLTACNFGKGDLLYTKFSESKQLCSYLQSCIIHDFDIFKFSKTATKNRNFFTFLKSHYFWLGGCNKMNLGAFWEPYLGFLKMLFHSFPHNIAKFISI